mmetsp:Transcript_14049/g.20582  ORF Transcript_14049/g.20582 Transcript_14049/m.20582 type:complete len:98 (-) Transcript_14049:446-739(-)
MVSSAAAGSGTITTSALNARPSALSQGRKRFVNDSRPSTPFLNAVFTNDAASTPELRFSAVQINGQQNMKLPPSPLLLQERLSSLRASMSKSSHISD